MAFSRNTSFKRVVAGVFLAAFVTMLAPVTAAADSVRITSNCPDREHILCQ
jgi:hypothetical protein